MVEHDLVIDEVPNLGQPVQSPSLKKHTQSQEKSVFLKPKPILEQNYDEEIMRHQTSKSAPAKQ
jgi:hypothetical protein